MRKKKRIANDLLLGKYEHWQNVVNDSDNPFALAAKLAVIGNIIDYGAHSVHEKLSDQIDSFFQKEIAVNRLEALQDEIKRAESVLYLGDNCGEIVFDKLFIETINHPNVTFVVRGKPVLNDVTLDDAIQVGMDKICRVISNGTDAPSTLLNRSPDNFVSEFNNAELIISKGQGNFEGLVENDHPNIFFLLIAKCNPIAELLGVKKHDMVIIKKNYIRSRRWRKLYWCLSPTGPRNWKLWPLSTFCGGREPSSAWYRSAATYRSPLHVAWSSRPTA